MADKLVLFDKFYAGIVRDDISEVSGALSNAEEVDIFSNEDYVQAEQIMSADTMPAGTAIYAYTAGDDDTVYGYGKETTGGKVSLVSVANGGSDNPGAFSTLFTSTDGINLATIVSDFTFFRTTESSNPTSLYYIKGTGSSWYLVRYNIGAAAEQVWNGSAWAAGTPGPSTQLTGLTGSFMRPTMEVIFGELYICHGQYIAKVGTDGTFTEKAFTLPKEWEAVDIVAVSDISLILCRNKNRLVNLTRAFWWDLAQAATFEDQYTLQMGGPQWILNYKETLFLFCAQNGIGKFFVSQAFPGAKPRELDNILLTNLGTETSTQPISAGKMVSTKDGIVYFGLYKTDKSGIYALGQLESSKPYAMVLSKRFDTSDYSLHKPTALLIQGSNYYAAFDDNGIAKNSRCETKNSPNRSSHAVIETIWHPLGNPLADKDIKRAYLVSDPLPAGTSLSLSVATDFSNSYTAVKRADDSAFNTANGIFGLFRPAAFLNKKFIKAKVAFTSSGANSPKLRMVGIRYNLKPME